MKLVYVADSRTPPAWAPRGYEAALKLWERDGENTSQIAPGPWRHGWGVHHPADDHQAAFAVIAGRVTELRLVSYGLDLEYGWEYDGDQHGWGDQADPVEFARVEGLSAQLLTAAKQVPCPVWITCLAHKLYPYRLWLSAAKFVSPQLYGARDPLPDAREAYLQCVEQVEGAAPAPVRPSTPLPVPKWAWEMRTWRATALAERGPRPSGAPSVLPSWWWLWAAWKTAVAAREAAAGRMVPSLWAGQGNPRGDGACLRFDAEIMADGDYR